VKYITIPAPFTVVDPLTDEPTAEQVPFVKFVRLLVTVAAQKQAADTLQLIDIRQSVASMAPGDVWTLPDEWHAVLAAECKKLGGWAPAAILSAGAHLRAVVDAPSKDPRGVAVVNGATVSSSAS
jgi:hypothetical protein